MSHSINLLAAALLAGHGQGQVVTPAKDCVCQKGGAGRVFAQPTATTETRSWSSGWQTTSDGGWRTTSSSSSASGGSWIDNRPVLSKIRNFFRGEDDAPMMTQEVVQPGQGRIVGNGVAPRPAGNDLRRPLPTITEPPLAESIAAPKQVAPAVVRPGPAAPVTAPLPPVNDVPQIEIEPLSFRPAAAKGVTLAIAEVVVPDVQAEQPRTAPKPSLISPRFAEKVGQPGDYSWITGQLEIRGGAYVLHYATPDTVDRFGGSIVLVPQGDVRNLRHGDLVSAHGQVVQQGSRGSVYRARSIDLVER